MEVYTQPYDPKRPQICMDETNKQLLEDIQSPVPVKPGQVERIDYEYERNGTANLFIFVEPLT